MNMNTNSLSSFAEMSEDYKDSRMYVGDSAKDKFWDLYKFSSLLIEQE